MPAGVRRAFASILFFDAVTQADALKSALTVSPKASATPSVSASASPSPSEAGPPQKVTYNINPKATWCNGDPLSWSDIKTQVDALNGSNPACGYPRCPWGVGSCIKSLVNGHLPSMPLSIAEGETANNDPW